MTKLQLIEKLIMIIKRKKIIKDKELRVEYNKQIKLIVGKLVR